MTNPDDPQPGPRPVPSSISEISLSQAILAPLDALFQAQVHGARSFLNLLLQIGYPHVEINKDGLRENQKEEEQHVYTQDFFFNDPDGKKLKVSIPSLALVPVAPLSIDTASFKLDFKVENLERYHQMQESESEKIAKESEASDAKWNEMSRPWYLVQEPVSFKGNVAPGSVTKSERSSGSSSTINIEINLSRQPLPAGLDKLLTALQQSSTIEPVK